MIPAVSDPTPRITGDASRQDMRLREGAIQLEATFLAEMLKSAGMGQARAGFGGGAGEEQFASFLLQEQALAMARAGGIGLAESIFESLKERQDV